MKRIFFLIAALSLLAVSCRKSEPAAVDDGYEFNLSVKGNGFTRADATVGWTAGESVFVFFRPEGGEILDRYLTLVWNGSSFSQSGSVIPYGALGQGGALAAVYVPYLRNGVKPVYKDGGWTIDGGDVYYSCASGVEYTVDGADVSANVSMSIPDGYVQFAVDASAADEGDLLECNIADAFTCVCLGSDLNFTETAVGDRKMSGHKDGARVYFWGKVNSVTADQCQWTLSTAAGNLVKSVASSLVLKNNAYNLSGFVCPDAGALHGLFSISSTEKVRFSQGNLYCIRSGSEGAYSYSFAFEDQQYYFRTKYGADWDTANLSGGVENTPENTSGFFQYITEIACVGDPDDECYDPVKFSDAIGSCGAFPALDRDEIRDARLYFEDIEYGRAMGPQWHLLSDSEWNYILGEYGSNWRPNAQNLRTMSTVCGISGVVLAPDDWDLTAAPLQDSYDAAAWSAAESAGLVFLPAAGYLDTVGIYHDGDSTYWTATNEGSTTAYCVKFKSDGELTMYGYSREILMSVRLAYRQ